MYIESPQVMMSVPMSQRFVIQNHAAPGGDHFDLMLEVGDVLATWRIGRPAADLAEGEAIDATALGDHRLAYLDYEGDLTDGRGSVTLADAGEYETLQRTDDLWRFELRGRSARGAFELRHADGDRWELKKGPRSKV